MNKKIIDAHWKYIERLLYVHNEDKATIRKIEYHYKTAMQHGWKHCKQDILKIIKESNDDDPLDILESITKYLGKDYWKI